MAFRPDAPYRSRLVDTREAIEDFRPSGGLPRGLLSRLQWVLAADAN